MPDEQKPDPGQQIARVFEQPPDAVSFYADTAQVVSTGNEVVLQFYETIPGPPGPDGRFRQVRTRLRATVTVSPRHALNIGQLLLKNVQQPTLVAEKPTEGGKL